MICLTNHDSIENLSVTLRCNRCGKTKEDCRCPEEYLTFFKKNRLWNTKPEKMKSTELLSYLWTRFMTHFRNSHFYHLMYQRKLWYLQIDWRQIAKIKTLISDLVFSQKAVDLYVTLHLHVILIYNHAIENEFDFYCLLKKVKKNQWFTPRQYRNYLIMTQSYDLTDAVFHDGVGGVTSILESAVGVMETNQYLRRRWTARSHKAKNYDYSVVLNYAVNNMMVGHSISSEAL